MLIHRCGQRYFFNIFWRLGFRKEATCPLFLTLYLLVLDRSSVSGLSMHFAKINWSYFSPMPARQNYTRTHSFWQGNFGWFDYGAVVALETPLLVSILHGSLLTCPLIRQSNRFNDVFVLASRSGPISAVPSQCSNEYKRLIIMLHLFSFSLNFIQYGISPVGSNNV
jgi:hypothetical protein